MKLLKIKNNLKIFTDLKFAIFVLITIAIFSSIGSFLEQDEISSFYIENYPINKPIYGFIDSNLILNMGLDHVYRTWWFLLLLFILGICLISCTVTRQFPLFIRSKEYFFKRKKKSFETLPFFVELENNYFLKEKMILKIQELNFYIYQNKMVIYGYKGLIGRISPILVHFSLILILFGSSVGAFQNFKAQEVLPKGELFQIQNPIRVGYFTLIPTINTRINDFWVEYENNKIHQFYSNLSLLDIFGNEIKNQTISVNNPLRYNNIDIYQSDWNLLGIRLKKKSENKIYEVPLFPLPKSTKAWITWVEYEKENYCLVLDKMQYNFLIYTKEGKFIGNKNIGDFINIEDQVIDILPSTGLLIKYDPSIPLIYIGFGLLMITASLSYLPYTQLWILSQAGKVWIGGITNRGKIQLEIEFENLIRSIEKEIKSN